VKNSPLIFRWNQPNRKLEWTFENPKPCKNRSIFLSNRPGAKKNSGGQRNRFNSTLSNETRMAIYKYMYSAQYTHAGSLSNRNIHMYVCTHPTVPWSCGRVENEQAVRRFLPTSGRLVDTWITLSILRRSESIFFLVFWSQNRNHSARWSCVIASRIAFFRATRKKRARLWRQSTAKERDRYIVVVE